MTIELLKSFFVILESGSLNKAAQRLGVSQSTLTRQIQSLEQELGTQVLERVSSGVLATATGQELFESMLPVVQRFDAVAQNVRRFARGQRESLRIGYIASAAAEYLNEGLAKLRAAHPDLKVKLMDMSPGEQMAALRGGLIDVALLGHAGPLLSREFYTRRVATVPVLVAMASGSALAARAELRWRDLGDETFVGAAEADMPGHNRWVSRLCRRAGFRPRFVHDADSLSHGLSTVVIEGAILLVPQYVQDQRPPGVAFRALVDGEARWELHVAWQRGRIAPAVKTLLDALATSRS